MLHRRDSAQNFIHRIVYPTAAEFRSMPATNRKESRPTIFEGKRGVFGGRDKYERNENTIVLFVIDGRRARSDPRNVTTTASNCQINEN